MVFYKPNASGTIKWKDQLRDGKGRWIYEGGIGGWKLNGRTYTGKVIGTDGKGNAIMEVRTDNGKPVEARQEVVAGRELEMKDIKATLDAPIEPGFDEADMKAARNADKRKPTPASYPTGTKVTASDGEYTKDGDNSWTNAEGETLTNDDVTARLGNSDQLSADIPDDAPLSAENILNATDGSTLAWKNKTYSRLEGKWFDEKTGKPVSDKTMRTKTDGDLNPEGTEDTETPTPTPASEYETGTKLHAEMNEGQSTADLEKTDDNTWDITTDSSETPSETDDATVDSVIEASDTLDDFLLNPTESEPTAPAPNSPKQLEDELDAAYKAWDDLDIPKYDDDENPIPFTDDERAELERIRGDFERISADAERFEDPEDARYAEGIKSNADTAVDDVNEALTESPMDAPNAEPEIETETDESVEERINTLAKSVDDYDNGPDTTDDDLDVLKDIDRELAELDAAIEKTSHPRKDAMRKSIAEQRAEIQATVDLTEGSSDNESEPTPTETNRPVLEDPQAAEETGDEEIDNVIHELRTQNRNKSYIDDLIERGDEGEIRAELEGARQQQEVLKRASRDYPDNGEIPVLEQETGDKISFLESALNGDDDSIDLTPRESAPTPTPEAEEDIPARTPDDILDDLDTTGAEAVEAISSGDDDTLNEARTALLDTYQEAQQAIDSPDTSNEDKVRLQSKVEEVDRAVTAIDQEIASRNEPEPETETETETPNAGWEESDIEGIEFNELEDGAVLQIAAQDGGKYGAYVFPPGSDTDIGPSKRFNTPEEAREAAQSTYDKYDPAAGTRPAPHAAEDLEGGHQADPQPVDESLSTPNVEETIRDTQEAAENGTLDVEDVDPSADFTPSPDAELRRTNAQILANPQEGDTITRPSGRSEFYENGSWYPVEDDGPSVSNDTQKDLNKAGPKVFVAGSAGQPTAEAPETADDNKHGIPLQYAGSPDHLQITNEDGTQETYTRKSGRWHRRLDKEGNLNPNHINNGILNAKLNNARQVATKKKGAPVSYYGEQEITPKPGAPVPAPEPTAEDGGGLVPGAKHVPSKPKAGKGPLGSHITDRPAKAEPNKVLTQDGKAIGLSDAEGNAYYVGDRIVYTDRSNNVRSARVISVGPKGPDKKPGFELALDEHDPSTPEGKISFDEWHAMSQKERVDAGLPEKMYSKNTRLYQDSLTKSNARLAVNETRDDVQSEFDRVKEEGRVSGNNVAEPEILDDVSIDRVVRDGSTAITGTTNKFGELFQRGEVVEYGPNGEHGTIVYIGEADNAVRIAPNGQSALESQYAHVDTISHSMKPATYYDKNYDLPAQERVARDLFNNELRVGSTVYRGGFPFTVKDIYPDGSKIRVVGQDWAGEQGSAGSLSFDQLIDLGHDPEMAREIAGAREHDFMPDHLQVFTGDVNDIQSIRTHDSHMMTLTRDKNGNVLDTQQNREALTSRAVGTKSNVKQTNSAIARYHAENGDSERYERDGIKPGDTIDQGIDQAASDNLQQYVNLTFGTDLVIPDNSRMIGYNKFGQYETYTKKDNKWTIDGIEGGYEMSAQEFYQYRLNNGYIPNKEGDGDPDQFRMRLTYLGDADEKVVPKAGKAIRKTDDSKFAVMPTGAVVQFKDADGNIITIRKGSDGQWYKVTSSGAWAPGKGPVDHRKVAGTATFRGVYNKEVPLPKSVDTTSKDAVDQRVDRQKREVERNAERQKNGGIDRIYPTNTTAEGTFREGVANTEEVRSSRQANEQLAAERDQLARENAEANRQMEAMKELLRKAGVDPDLIDDGDEDSVTASMGNRITATRRGTDQVLAVYNRVSDNVWEHVSARGYKREFVLNELPSTPGVTYKVEENVA